MRHWNFHLFSFWLALLLLCDVSYVTINEKFAWYFSIVEQRTSQSNDNASGSSVYQGCGGGTQISGSGSTSGHLNFLAPAPTSRSFWLRLQNNLVQNIRKTFYGFICVTRLPHKLSLWIRNPNFRLRLHPKVLAPAPAIQNCFGSGIRFHSPAAYWAHSY